MNTKENKPKAKSKKDLLREIIEIDDRFDTNSLSRTNITNLKLVHELVLKVQLLARARLILRPTPKTITGEYNMNYANVLFGIEILGLILFFCLPFIAYQIYKYTDLISFVLFIMLFWTITAFTTFLLIARWAIVLGY